jgi:hypothetical protein
MRTVDAASNGRGVVGELPLRDHTRPRPTHSHADERTTGPAFRETGAMHAYDPLRFHGTVTWLTHEQGGRRTGPPTSGPDRDYAATGFVPPLNVDTGLASLVVRPATPGAWRSAADAGWLVGDFQYPHDVAAGNVIVVTEGPTVVGYFHVESVG